MWRSVEFEVAQHILMARGLVVSADACRIIPTLGHRVVTIGIDTLECSGIKAEIRCSIAIFLVLQECSRQPFFGMSGYDSHVPRLGIAVGRCTLCVTQYRKKLFRRKWRR
ncbi:hypothetical protein D3C84_826050 [compost metagenome]